MAKKLDPEVQKQQDKLREILRAITILSYGLAVKYMPLEIRDNGVTVTGRYTTYNKGSGGIKTVSLKAEKKAKTTGSWQDSHTETIYPSSYYRQGLILNKLQEKYPKVSSKTAELEVTIDSRPGIEAIDYSESVIQKELGISKDYGTYTVTVRGTAEIWGTSNVVANSPEEAEKEVAKGGLNSPHWYTDNSTIRDRKISDVKKAH